MLFASPPFSAGYAWHAFAGARGKWVTRIGLALSVVETLAAIVLLLIGLIMEPPSNRI